MAAIEVVELLDLTRTIVTAGALHCHHRMAEAIILRGGGSVLALKANRQQWCAEVMASKPLMAGHAAFIRNIFQTTDKLIVPISHRIKKCAWNDAYLTQAIAHMR